MTKYSGGLTIFEGPDGSGKTTAAKWFAQTTGAKYVHFGPLPHVSDLGRVYVEAMLPALLGYQSVVFDRSWLSEEPYGEAFRGGANRLGPASCRMLDRLALRCGGVLVRCDPGWEAIKSSFMARRQVEMLDNEDQLHQVWKLYRSAESHLPQVSWDYQGSKSFNRLLFDLEALRTPLHPLSLSSAGNWAAPILLVGENFGPMKNQDAFYQWPFASFSHQSCSQWLANHLNDAGIGEELLLWVNADQDLPRVTHLGSLDAIITLGSKAHEAVKNLNPRSRLVAVAHPQAVKRFGCRRQYGLTEVIKEALK